MTELQGKVAVVTGASGGIGAATARALVEAGMTVVGLARRKEKIEELASELRASKGQLHSLKADLRSEEDIKGAFQWVSDNLGMVHVLVNNAGLMMPTTLKDGDTEKWRNVLDVNVLAPTIAAREAIRIMSAKDIAGHIVNLNSVAGHKVISDPGFNVYSASKYAVTALTETLRYELIRTGSKIKVTSLSPGVVGTDLFEGCNSTIEEVKQLFKLEQPLEAKDIADAIKYVIATPSHVQVTELTIRPVGQEF